MAKTNAKGFFCDHPCGFMSSKCQNFFCAGCASAGMKLHPNTEYPDVKVMQLGSDSQYHEKK